MNILIFVCASYLIYVAILYVLVRAIRAGSRRHALQMVSIALGSAVISWVIGHFLKDLIAHPRPDAAFALLVPNDPYSFPSGHASFMFALAFAAYYFNTKTGMVLLLFALITGVARVLAHVHFWYDIVGGCVLGLCVASLCCFIYKKFFTRV